MCAACGHPSDTDAFSSAAVNVFEYLLTYVKDPELGLQDYLWHRCPKTGFNAYFVAANQDQTVILQIVDGSSSNGTHRRNNITGNSALHEAALRGQVNAVSYMVALDLDLKLERNEAKLTPVQCVEAKLTDEPHYEEQRRLLAVCKELSSNSGAPEAQARVRVVKSEQDVIRLVEQLKLSVGVTVTWQMIVTFSEILKRLLCVILLCKEKNLRDGSVELCCKLNVCLVSMQPICDLFLETLVALYDKAQTLSGCAKVRVSLMQPLCCAL